MPQIRITSTETSASPGHSSAVGPRGRIRRLAASFGVSVGLHSVVLLIMSMWIIPFLLGRDRDLQYSEIDTRMSNGEFPELSAPLSLSESEVEEISPELTPLVPRLPTPELPELNEEKLPVPKMVDGELASNNNVAPPSNPTAALKSASGAEEAVDDVIGDIKNRLKVGDLLVVWLFDGSRSLLDDRRRVAGRLEPFFRDIAEKREDSQRHELSNAVVSFGSIARERVSPTIVGTEVLAALEDLPVDSSGKENVFGAIEQCCKLYGGGRNAPQILTVVWTDESGDDAQKLEQTIRRCRSSHVSVSVVGPSSVLGSDRGLHAYKDPDSKLVYHLPVTRGPDTAVPERLQLPYWFKGRVPRWARVDGAEFGRRRRQLPSWYGGDSMSGLVSGFGPYSLTRLTIQTGGSYTILDRAEDAGPFQFNDLLEYAPDYRSAAEYMDEIEAHPIRRGVYTAAKMTSGKKGIKLPPLMFFGEQLAVPPYRFEQFYFPPGQFRTKISREIPAVRRKAQRLQELVNRALLQLSHKGDVWLDFETEYEQESSKRWRAWYDLTRGRLLATSVRLEEYILTCDQILKPGFLDRTTNFIVIVAVPDTKFDETYTRRVEEATRLLTRCIKENPDTPWAYLAQRELDYSAGLDVRQHALALTGPRSNNSRPNLPKL